MRLERSLTRLGVAPRAARVLTDALLRSHGMVVFCGASGTGKTTLAQLVIATQRRAVVHWVGDIRMPDDVRAALLGAERALVVGVVRSGESMGLRDRWSDMGIAESVVERAAVVPCRAAVIQSERRVHRHSSRIAPSSPTRPR